MLNEEEHVRPRKNVGFQPALLWRDPASVPLQVHGQEQLQKRERSPHSNHQLQPETKLEESFIRSIDKSFSLGLTEYQKVACCTHAEFKGYIIILARTSP